MGGKHSATSHGQVIQDEKNNVFTTPCYMLDSSISQIYDGAYNIVKAMLAKM
jgi:enhancing lycopene biosynthesis protein 2